MCEILFLEFNTRCNNTFCVSDVCLNIVKECVMKSRVYYDVAAAVCLFIFIYTTISMPYGNRTIK